MFSVQVYQPLYSVCSYYNTLHRIITYQNQQTISTRKKNHCSNSCRQQQSDKLKKISCLEAQVLNHLPEICMRKPIYAEF